MIRTKPLVSIVERLLLLASEGGDPDRRFSKSLFLFVLSVSCLAELFLGLNGLALGRPESLVIHGLLAAGFAGSVTMLRNRFHPTGFTLLFGAFGIVSSSFSLLSGPDFGALFWHLVLPSWVLILRGESWGWIALLVDLGLVVLHGFWLAAQPTPVSVTLPLGIGSLICWALAGVLLFGLTWVFYHLIQQTLAVYRTEQGQVLGLLTQAKNSEARWADQARFLETLMDAIPFPLFHKGVDGRYLTANASFRVVFDVQKEAISGHRNETFLRPENAKTLAKIELDVLARDSMAVEETVLIHADGFPHDFIVYLMPFIDADRAPQGYIGILIDITERKDREEKLVQLNSTKDQLFSIISHDLRGPVGKLKQLLDIYMDDPGIFNKTTWDQVFHDMRRSADSLFQLLENLLSWARAQQGEDQVRYEALPLEPLVGDVFAVLKLLASEKKIALEMNLQLAGPLLTDRHVLSTILRNLVHNALKFTTPGGKITVTAGETPDDLWIEVRDTGIGMAPETIHRLFQRRERLSTYGTGKERGQGIGLGLCQDLAETLGAHLEVESALGQGTAIRLHLPTPEL